MLLSLQLHLGTALLAVRMICSTTAQGNLEKRPLLGDAGFEDELDLELQLAPAWHSTEQAEPEVEDYPAYKPKEPCPDGWGSIGTYCKQRHPRRAYYISCKPLDINGYPLLTEVGEHVRGRCPKHTLCMRHGPPNPNGFWNTYMTQPRPSIDCLPSEVAKAKFLREKQSRKPPGDDAAGGGSSSAGSPSTKRKRPDDDDGSSDRNWQFGFVDPPDHDPDQRTTRPRSHVHEASTSAGLVHVSPSE